MKLLLAEALADYNQRHPSYAMNQKDLATRMGITEALVSKHMRGRVLPGISTLARYAIVLDTSTDSLLHRD